MKARKAIALNRREIDKIQKPTRNAILRKIRKNVSIGWAQERLRIFQAKLLPLAKEYDTLVIKLRKNSQEKERIKALEANIFVLEDQCKIFEELIKDLQSNEEEK